MNGSGNGWAYGRTGRLADGCSSAEERTVRMGFMRLRYALGTDGWADERTSVQGEGRSPVWMEWLTGVRRLLKVHVSVALEIPDGI